MTNPDNVGGLYPSGDDVDRLIELAIDCGIDNRGTSWLLEMCQLRAKLRATHDVGGLLPELPEPEAYEYQHEETGLTQVHSRDGINTPEVFMRLNQRYQHVASLYTASQMRVYGELCRAAPAGGEPVMYQQIHRHHHDAKWEECSKAIFDQYTEYHRKYGGVPPVRALYER